MTTNKHKGIFKRFYTGMQSNADEKELLETEEVNELMKNQWDHPEEVMNDSEKPDFDAMFNHIERKAYVKRTSFALRALQIAAGIAILAGLAAAFYFVLLKDNAADQIKFTTLPGQIKSFTLPDGSTIWLGENSRLSIADNFSDVRKVDLEGLAFFEVIHNNKPFLVDASQVTVEVTGTSFSVSDYIANKEIEVILKSGAVKIIDSKGKYRSDLKPDERFVLNKLSGSHFTESVNAHQLTLWKEKKLIFNNKPLSEIAAALGNRFDMKFIVDENATNYNFTFNLSTETLEETLLLISSLAPIESTQTNDTTILFHLRK